jgi:dTDP-4-amino-4,6-dideoxygalactose transaminase
MIHYPVYPIMMPYFGFVGHTKSNTLDMSREHLSLPIYSGMSKADVDYVIEKVNEYP